MCVVASVSTCVPLCRSLSVFNALYLALSVAVLPALVQATCHGPVVKQRTLECRLNYDNQVKALLSDRAYYYGLDAETIRTICQ